VPARRSQLVVISDDHEVIRACQTVAARTDHLRPARRALHPDRIPPGLGLNDWIVADLDYIGNESGDWQAKIQALAAQIIVTASEERPSADDPSGFSAGRFLPKARLEKNLQRIITGDKNTNRQPSRPGAAEETVGRGADRGLVWARQVGEFAQRIATFEYSQIVQTSLEQLSTWFGARLASLYEVDDRGDCLILAGKIHPYPIDERIELGLHERQPIIRAAKARRLIVVGSWQEAPPLLGQDVQRPHADTYRTEACILAPILVGERLKGIVNLADPTGPSGFDTQLVGLIGPTCSLIGVALSNAKLFQQVQEQARTDSLTGLVNRRSFAPMLGGEIMRARRYGTALSLVMIDMDGLKDVNDTYGHLAGDAVIREVAERIRSTIREIDIACRYGGDEFTVILPNTSLEQAHHAADRLAAAVAGLPCRWQGIDIPITISVGVCRYDGQTRPAEFIRGADAALYAAKSRGRNCVAAARV